MIFTKALVLKVLGGLAACTGVAIGGVKLWERSGKGQGGGKPQPSQLSENPSGGGVNSNPSNQNNAQNLQQQPQTQQNPSAADGNPPTQTPSQSLQVPTKAKTTITTSNAELLLKELGLECSEDTTNNKIGECTGITEGKTITVKWDEKNKREGITSLTIPSGAKIKYEKYAGDNNYNKNLKITIEGGDITLNGGTPETITKLEEFETYEVKEEGSGQDKKYYLKRKINSSAGKSKALGLPDKCVLPENETPVSCTLSVDELKKINFEGKGSNQTTILESDDTKQSTLTIVKTPDSEFNTEGYKFTLKTEYTISFGSGSQNNKIISNTNTEFKIKVTTPANGGAKTLTLEKAWNLNNLASKIGLTDCNTDSSDCTLPATINVSNGESDKIKDAKITVTNPKIKFLKDQPKHNQGFKFNTLSDISLSGGNPEANNKKIESSNNTTYEIKKIENEWYLSKVSSK